MWEVMSFFARLQSIVVAKLEKLLKKIGSLLVMGVGAVATLYYKLMKYCLNQVKDQNQKHFISSVFEYYRFLSGTGLQKRLCTGLNHI